MTKVKICGLKDMSNLRAALNAGADYIGFVFYPASTRYIDSQTAWTLSREIPSDVTSVGLFVNPPNRELNEALSRVKLGMIQLHGDETPLRVIEIRAAYKLPVMKAIRIGGLEDLAQIEKYEKAADWLLFDTKIENEAGGTGKSFDWTLLKGKTLKKPWMLGGGLNAGNVRRALTILQPSAVDVSSGVERERGMKDPAKIRTFINAVKHG